MRRRSRSDASTARWSSSSRCRVPSAMRRKQLEGDRNHHAGQQHQAADQEHQEGAPQLGGALADDGVVEVDLQQGALAVRAGQCLADLDQPARDALVLVLGALRRGDLGLRPA